MITKKTITKTSMEAILVLNNNSFSVELGYGKQKKDDKENKTKKNMEKENTNSEINHK